MLLTLGAAGATLLVVLAVLGVPAIDACKDDGRGLVTCLRGMADDKFDLGLLPHPAAQPDPLPVAGPIVAEAPVQVSPEVQVTPDVQVAEVPVAEVPVARPEPSRSLAPQVADKPAISPPPKVIATPPLVVVPDVPPVAPELPVAAVPAPEEPDVAPAETIALATIVDPAPSFVPPSPAISVEGVPPDLLIAAVEPDAAPTLEAAVEPVQPPSFVPPAPTITLDGVPPDLQIAAAAPDPPTAIEPAPDFVLATTPELPGTPPPDLTVAAVDPIVPAELAPAVTPSLAPSIDAVEIDGDGNFIAGNGPAGATMRLYVDGIPVGMSPVEGGRWLVEGTDLLTEEQQVLKVEALDPLTGKVLGDATIIFEGPLGPAVDEPIAEDEAASVDAPVSEPPAPAVEPEGTIEQLEAPVEAVPVPPEAEAAPPAAIPQIAPVVPSGESPSVIILKPLDSPSITTLPTGKPSEAAIVTLGVAPTSPAIRAQFTLPVAEAAPDVTVLRAMPIGDPGAGRFVSGKAIIRRGDTLWAIAHRYYGHGVHYRTIFRANRELIARPGRIYPGQVFDLPLVYDD